MKLALPPRGTLFCTLLASTALATGAAPAQTAPPVNHNVDSNGVDVVLGRFDLSQTLISIGPDWPRGLHYTRMRDGAQWVDNFTGGLYQSLNRVFVSVGNSSTKFTYSGTGGNLLNPGSFTPELADGSTLTRSGGVFTFTNGRGDVARFTGEIGSNGRIVAGTGRMMDLRYPSGAVVTLNYRTESVCDENQLNCVAHFRIQSITNNFNYQLHLAYAENGPAGEADPTQWRRVTAVRAINTAVEACDPYADSCSLTGAWPAAAIAVASGYETVTLPDGNAWRFTPDGGDLTGVRRPGSTSDDVTIAYGSGGLNVASVTGVAGTWSYAYSDSGTTRTTTVSGPLGGSRTLVSDTDREIITSDQDALGRTTIYQYDGNDRVTRITAPEGNYLQLTYDGRGNVTESRAVGKAGYGMADLVETASYPSTCSNPVTCNQPSSVTDARGNATDFTYDSTHGGPLTMTAPAPSTGAVRPQTRFGYTASTVGGETVRLPASVAACQTQSSCAGAADEVVTTISYSGANFLPTSVSSGNGSGTLTATGALAYDDIGNRITIDGPLSGTADTTRLRYNALRQVTGIVGPDPDGAGALKHRATRVSYDNAGLETASETGTVNSQSDGDWAAMTVLQRAETERDGLGRPVARRLIAGGTTYALGQTSYDARGRTDCVAERMNPAEFASPPSSACTLDTQGSFGPDRISRTTYDAADQVTKVETGYGVTGVAADEARATYTGNGLVQTMTDANGNASYFHYDGHDRLQYWVMPSATAAGYWNWANIEFYGYDANGNRTLLVRRDGNSITFSYDNLNRVTAKDLPGSEPTVSYTYDLMGRMLSASTSSPSHTLTFAFDALSRNTSQSGPHGTVAYAYDLADRRTQMTYADSGLVVGYVYNVAGDMTEIRENPSGSNGLLGSYAYDDLGRRTSLTRGNGAVTSYAYDNASRLTQLVQNLNGTSSDLTLDFTLSPAGDIATNTRSNDAYAWTNHYAVTRAYTTNGLNQYTGAGAITPTYDNRGNLTSAGSVTYAYSSENQLTGASGGVTLAYDPAGRLYQTSGGSITRFGYDGGNMIAEYDSSNVLQRRFVFGPANDEPLVWYEGTGTSTRRYFHADERGSVVAISDGSGAMFSIDTYDEYGIPGSSNSGRFQYTGQAWLGEIGMYHYRARAYSPTLGRFMQTDPIGYAGGMNLYAYVGNDPVNFVDPSGLRGCKRDEGAINVCGPDIDRGGPGGAGVGGNAGPVLGLTVSAVSMDMSDQNVLVIARRRCGFFSSCGFKINQLANNRQVLSNIRAIVRTLAGNSLSEADLDELMARVILEIGITEIPAFARIQVPPRGRPLTLTQQQRNIIDRLFNAVGRDALGQRALRTFNQSIQNGRIIVR